MSASTLQPKSRRERRIIERPRLIKLLDECEARIILLLAPAGYGKTTLARQWAKTLNRCIWITCTPAHRDVVTFAEDLSRGLGQLGNGIANKFLREFVSGQSNPQRSSRRLSTALVRELRSGHCQWLIIDDYHEIADSTGVEHLVEALHASLTVNSSSRLEPALAGPHLVELCTASWWRSQEMTLR